MNFLNVRLVSVDGDSRLKADGMDLGLPEGKFRSSCRWIGRELILGVRPEQIHPATTEQPQQNHEWIEGTVEVLEPLGSETLVHLRAGNQEIVAMCDPDRTPIMNSKMRSWIDMNKIHLFDPASESSIA